MNTHDSKTTSKPRLSLEKKVKILARKFRSGKCRRDKRKHGQSCRSELLRTRISMVAVLALLVFSFTGKAAIATPTFEQANAAFASGNYPAAIDQYNAILAHEGYSAPVLFNLGNAYYRNGQFGAAILNYERAGVLAPRDAAIEANLRQARGKAGVPPPKLNEIQKAARFLSPNVAAWIGSITLVVLCAAIGGHRLFPRFTGSKTLIAFAAVILLTIVTSCGIRWPEFGRAIVVGVKVPARIAPANTAAELFPLPAGASVITLRSFGRFTLVRTPDGRSGWVSEKEIGRVFSAKSPEIKPG